MKIISKLGLALLFCLSMMALVNPVAAAEPSPADTPPQMQNLTEDEDIPAVTKSEKERVKQTTHTSQQGGQTEVRVTNEVGTYIVRPNQTVGNSLPGDAQSSSNHAVQWVVKSWGGNKNSEPIEAPSTLPDHPGGDNSLDASPK